jgi:ABC-2 type transport system ATP-binding protein
MPEDGSAGPDVTERKELITMQVLSTGANLSVEVSGGGGVRVRDLRKTYAGGVEALRGVSFDVHPGEVFGLLGPNGAGKTTTIGVLTTTVRPTSGDATVGGFDVTLEPLAARRASGIVFQDSVLDGPLTGRQNLALHARLWRMPKGAAAARIQELAGVMGLTDLIDRPVRTYSGGQRRRLEIARGVLASPSVLFLDEPTVGLDPTIRYELWALLREVRARHQVTVVLTTHYLDEAERLCDRIAVMHEGRIIAEGAPADLLTAFGEQVLDVEASGQTVPVTAALRAAGVPVDDALEIGSTLTIPLQNGMGEAAVRTLRQADGVVRSVALRKPTLDDVYLRLTGARLDG